ncbi:MAG TPA: anti-sigma F factor [Firmicutes bacterium]|nr:anti-sigma F factor [Bacillota bacterium]
MKMEFPAVAENVEFARVAVACFASQVGAFTLEEIDDIKLLISEAVSNAIIHGYPDSRDPGVVRVSSSISDDSVEMIVEDEGEGIEDVAQAMKPAYTTKVDRLGMGFTIMEALADHLEVVSRKGEGTRVIIRKRPAAAA